MGGSSQLQRAHESLAELEARIQTVLPAFLKNDTEAAIRELQALILRHTDWRGALKPIREAIEGSAKLLSAPRDIVTLFEAWTLLANAFDRAADVLKQKQQNVAAFGDVGAGVVQAFARNGVTLELGNTDWRSKLARCAEVISEALARLLSAAAAQRQELRKQKPKKSRKRSTAGEVGRIAQIFNDFGFVPSKRQLAAKMLIHSSALSREPRRSAYEKAAALWRKANVPKGTKDADGNLEAYSDEE